MNDARRTSARSSPACALGAAAAFVALIVLAGTPVRAAGTRYFAVVPGSPLPVAIGSFSSDARADVAAFAYGSNDTNRIAHGKFAVASNQSPFATGKHFATLIVLAQTPEKLITFTFTGVTIDEADASSGKNDRVEFEAENYSVKYTGEHGAGGASGTP